MKKSIVILINNEFHLFITLLLYYQKYIYPAYDFKVLISKQEKSKRIIFEQYELPFNYIKLNDIFDDVYFKGRINYEQIINKTIKNADELYLFHDSALFNTYLIRLFKKKFNTKIFLIQEGIAGYYKRKIYWSQLIRYSLKYLHFKYNKKYNVKYVRKWGTNNEIDCILMLSPENVIEKIKAPLEKLELNITEDEINKVSKAFKFDIHNYVSSKNKVLLYLSMGNARRTRHLKKREIEVVIKLIQVSIKYGYSIVIKAKGNENLKLYQNAINENIIFITEPIPAELISFKLTNSIICSWFSSSNLYQKKTNKYIWMNKLLGLPNVISPKLFGIIEISNINDLEKVLILD